MFRSKILLLAGMSFVLIFAGSGFLSAAQNEPEMAPGGEGPPIGPPMGPPRGPARGFQLLEFVRGLDLTDEQREQIREILDENKDPMDQARRNVIQAQENLDADFPETAEALGSAHAGEALLRAQVLEKIKQLLTAEQLDLLEIRQQMRKDRLDGFPGRFGKAIEK